MVKSVAIVLQVEKVQQGASPDSHLTQHAYNFTMQLDPACDSNACFLLSVVRVKVSMSLRSPRRLLRPSPAQQYPSY
jgi:hypothetical protein